MTNPNIVPLLVVRGAARAIDFYVAAFGACVLARYEHGAERRISHADLAFGAATFSLTEEARDWHSDAPESLGGSPVVLQLGVEDAAAVLTAVQRAGGSVLQPLGEWLGERMARVRDPFGHVWLLRQRVEDLPAEEIQRRRDQLFEHASSRSKSSRMIRPAPDVPQEQSGRVHLVLGPVGAGKSTFAIGLAREQAALRFTLDEWMAILFRPDRPGTGLVAWYVERAARCVDQIWELARGLCRAGTNAVLEIGLLDRAARERFYDRVVAEGLGLAVYVLDAPRELRRARVAERNRTGGPTFSALVPAELFELASDLWEPVDPSECDGREVRFIDTGACGEAASP